MHMTIPVAHIIVQGVIQAVVCKGAYIKQEIKQRYNLEEK